MVGEKCVRNDARELSLSEDDKAKACIDCVSLSSKCAYVKNGSSKGSGETAQMRILA